MSDADAPADQAAAEATATAVEATDADAPEQPRDELREDLLGTFTEALGDKVLGSHIDPGRELWVRVPREVWTEAAEVAKLRLGCAFFDFLSAIDWLPSPWGRYEDDNLDASAIPRPDPHGEFETGVAGGDTRFQVFARLANIRKHHSVILKADLPGFEPGDEGFSIASLVPLFEGASWHERECWEMFGITFEGHPHLRHLYLPGAFEGNPLRKDFPLLARLVKPWPGVVDVEPMPDTPDADAASDPAAAESNGNGGNGDDSSSEGTGQGDAA